MNPSLDPLLRFHPLVVGRLEGGIRCSTDGQFASGRHLERADWVVAFCYGRKWCRLVSKSDYLDFIASELAKPVKEEYTHSVVVPQVLDQFCEELLSYQSGNGVYAYVLTLALAHFSLQLDVNPYNPYALDIKRNIRQCLIRLAIFYFLLYSCPYMEEWGRLTNVDQQYGFVWEQSAHFHKTAEALHLALSQQSRYGERHTWIQWVETRLGVIADDSEIEFRHVEMMARTHAIASPDDE
jgi:hypothetical protein